MTRINVIDPALLSDKHLGAEYRELPRVFGEVRRLINNQERLSKLVIPKNYCLGKGHVTFFYDKLNYLSKRYLLLCQECRNRGRVVNYGDVSSLTKDIPATWFGDWSPRQEDLELNLKRINERGGLRDQKENVPTPSDQIVNRRIKMNPDLDKLLQEMPEHTNEELKVRLEHYRSYLCRMVLSRDAGFENVFRRYVTGDQWVAIIPPENADEFTKEKISILIDTVADFRSLSADYEEALHFFKKKHSKDAIDFNVEEDGITHINIYSKGKTELGRLLSNFAHTPFKHPKYGHFSSVEGFWYWISTGKVNDTLRSIYGYQAKKAGLAVRETNAKNGIQVEVENFQGEIKKAILCKIEQNDRLKNMLKNCDLPLTHYYVWGEAGNQRVTYPFKYSWIHEYINDVRDYLNNKAHKLVIAGSREITDSDFMEEVYRGLDFKVIEIVSGMARGPDMFGFNLAKKLRLPCQEFPADWDNKGNSAGFIRNDEMAKYASAALLFWDGKSNGTRHMADRCKNYKLVYKLITVNMKDVKHDPSKETISNKKH